MPNDKALIKREEINRRLAGYFLSLEPGINIDSVRDLAGSMDASIGLISESISRLEELGAIEIDRRGQLGSFLVRQSVGRLWASAMNQPLVIAHTLPSNRRYEGLATALKKAFNDVGVEAYFIFIRGSRTRLKALRENRCHIAIVSQFAAEGLCGRTEEIAATLAPGSFVKSHQVFFRNDTKNNQPINVAIDPDSYDQMQLSNIEFKDQPIDFHKITFMSIHHYLAEKKVDMAIWTEEDMENQLGNTISKRPLSEKTVEIVGGRNTKAALVTRTDDRATRALIQKVVDAAAINEIQQAVISGTLIPEY
ncbi:MAG: YhfZ family protein [Pelolinea sp.]|nr:YhfZ family protein [Pelolinea sp.]